jgi:CBS domain containing-hemolysin-like protein
VEKQQDGSFLVDAALEVDQFTQAFGFSLPDGDFDTLGGFLSSMAGHLPDVGERFTYNGWAFTVHAKEGARIDRVRMTKLKTPSKEPTPPKDSAGKDSASQELKA